MGNYEEEIVGNNIRKIHYLYGANSLAAVHVSNAEKDTPRSTYSLITPSRGNITNKIILK
jgi:hypothetical protein